ncbi:hypothetical protein EJB05_07811, partial [Eragrostis curvula]
MAKDDCITRRFAAARGQYARTGAPPAPCFVQDGSANAKQQQQLTIVYGGTVVVVLDGCAPEKAAELTRLAAAAAGQPALVDNSQIARNLSLRRFLSKRKERATAPEPEEEPAAKKGKPLAVSREEAASWLSLGSLATMHGR